METKDSLKNRSIRYLCQLLTHIANMMETTLLFALGMPELFLIVFLILLLFGAKRIPDLMKSMGKGVRSFKEGMSEIEKDINSDGSNKDEDKKK